VKIIGLIVPADKGEELIVPRGQLNLYIEIPRHMAEPSGNILKPLLFDPVQQNPCRLVDIRLVRKHPLIEL